MIRTALLTTTTISTTLRAMTAAMAVLTLTGCGLFGGDDGLVRDRSGAYRQAQEIPQVSVPEGLDASALGQLYPIPEIPETTLLNEDTGTLRPQPLSSNLSEEEVKIQSLGDKRWIQINRTPGEIWPRVRNILNTNAVPTAKADAASGTIETVWLEFDDDPLHFHRYLFQIEQGVQLNSTEVAVRHASMLRDGEAPTWADASTSEEREQKMSQFLASNLAGDLSESTVSLLAQSIGGGAKVETVTLKGEDPYLLIKLEFERSWASVAYAVSKDGFSIVDQNRSTGVFYVDDGGSENEDEPGFLGRLLDFGGDDNEADGEAEASASVDPAKISKYQVSLKATANGVQVHVIGLGDTLERTEVLRLLKRIRANLA